MMNEVERRLEDNCILLFLQPTKEIKACSIKMDNHKAIFFNPRFFENALDANTALYHEFYHCAYNSFYSLNDSIEYRNKMEFKTNYQMAMDLIPPSRMQTLFATGLRIWEVAELLGLNEEFLREAYRIYKSKGLI